jgi:putative DNA primase/helicase
MAQSAKKRGKTAPRYDIPYVFSTAHAAGWPSIFAALAGVDLESFDGKHRPCPKCGGTDRFRYTDADEKGGCICNQCGKHANGLDTLIWLTGEKFAVVLARVAEHLGINPLADSAASSSSSTGAKQPKADPAANLVWQAWNESLAELFCERKPPITTAGLLACGAKMARYRGSYTVIALPIWDERAIRQGVIDGAIVGWSLWNVTGGTLPGPDGEWLKVKLTAGTQSGLMGDPARIKSARMLLKVEGPSDLAAIHSLADLPPDVAPITNANGAGELPKPWMVETIAGSEASRREALICHDADKPGQRGAAGWKDERGRFHDGWAQRLTAGGCASVGNLTLPYEVAEHHGRDLRDYLAEGNGWAAVLALPRADVKASPPGGGINGDGSPTGENSPGQPGQAIEADNDPHRLARINLKKYDELTNGGKIVRWRGKWYTWKPGRGCYSRIDEDELRARIVATIKQEFDRLNLADAEQAIADGKEPPKALRVTRTLVTDVVHATASLTMLKSSLEPNSWIDPPNPLADPTDRPHMIAMKNGLLDLGLLILGEKIDDCLQPLTPNWFSFVRLPYGIDAQARCPEWEAFLEKSMEGDVDRINRLQEWAGYLLTPDNSFQKFLALEGEGRNGKSVYLAGVTAMLGCENVSNIKLEDLGERFQVAGTMGKLANICADTNEVDVRCEGFLKAFTAGDRIHVDLKYGDGVDFVPSARLMLAWNNRPRFSDKTDAIWRRILMVVWKYQVTDAEVKIGMDSTGYWERSGELPGMFKWALDGLIRLREAKKFTHSDICEGVVSEFRDEANPARSFLKMFTEEKPGTETASAGRIATERLYHFYCCWCKSQGNRFPLGAEFFGKEVFRLYGGKIKKIRPWISSDGEKKRSFFFEGIDFSCDEICGEKTGRDSLSGF